MCSGNNRRKANCPQRHIFDDCITVVSQLLLFRVAHSEEGPLSNGEIVSSIKGFLKLVLFLARYLTLGLELDMQANEYFDLIAPHLTVWFNYLSAIFSCLGAESLHKSLGVEVYQSC